MWAGFAAQLDGLGSKRVHACFFLESSLDILQYANEDIGMLDCRISPYFTADTQIIWPGREIGASSSDSWFTCTIKHSAGKYTTTAFLVQAQKEKESPNPEQLFPGVAERSHLSDRARSRCLHGEQALWREPPFYG
ncbi:hypothetical protein QYF61_017133 [Mycteria americana]|uniref:Uncharacterized protein n=1 Tax=Mycteria americana TaxID=33587 RepID=A0AAN7RXG3_MYCAM|nr:hypothetical protein QYF61_017133 [Mycteria americana]